MKTIFLVLLSITIASNLHAQNRQVQRMGVVYITVNGNKNLQLAIDGDIYSLNNSSGTVSKTNTPISDLAEGMHTLTLTDNNTNNNRWAANLTTQFNLRLNFDMYINLNADGSLELIEKKKVSAITNNTPMTTGNFNILLRNLKAQRTAESRNTMLTNTFNTSNTYFTSIQVVQLLQQIRSESDRLPLAKLSFRTVTDPNNFSPVYGLFYVQANRTELQNYVKDYDYDDSDNNNTNTGGGMPETNFNNLYETIKGQWPVTTQVNSITTAFNTTGNNFTAYQASQLIQLISSEATRLQLAKLSYHTVVDPANFNTVANTLYAQASRDDLANFVRTGGQVVVTTRTPMTDTDFTTLYQTVSTQFLPYAKMTYLTNTFNNAAYYFTATQAKTLIQLVSNESNRLQLAKLVYRNLVDRENYTQFNDLFMSASSRTELAAYVKAYRD